MNERPLLQHYFKFKHADPLIHLTQLTQSIMIWCLLLSFKPHPLFWSLKLKIFIFHLYNPSLKQMTLSYILAPDSYYNSSLISCPKKFKILKDSSLSQSDCRLILPWYLGNLFIHYYLQYPLLFLYIYWVVVILYSIHISDILYMLIALYLQSEGEDLFFSLHNNTKMIITKSLHCLK